MMWMPSSLARMAAASAASCTGQDFIDAVSRKWFPATASLQRHEQPVSADTGRSFGLEIRSRRGEEPCRDRHDPLMAALALADEHPPLPDVQIFQTQSEDLAAAQPTQHRREHHRPVPLPAQRSEQRIHLARHEDARKGAGRAHQRNTLSGPLPFPPGRQTPRHRICPRHHPGRAGKRTTPTRSTAGAAPTAPPHPRHHRRAVTGRHHHDAAR